MRRFLLFAGFGVAILVILAWGAQYFMTKHTKSFSPEEEVVFQDGNLLVRLYYNRPYKKGREIFGGLVPYDEVWRTGANEATTFETSHELTIEGKTLRAGKYSLWTIPGEDHWEIIFNTEFGQWGINSQGEANRDPSRDALSVVINSVQQDKEFEQFTIAFEKVGDNELEMVLMWDKTVVSVPIHYPSAI